MCNHHFFQDKSNYLEFLKTSRKLAIIMDPPFGVKVELIWHGCIQGVQKDLAQVQNFKNRQNNDLNFDGKASSELIFYLLIYSSTEYLFFLFQ